MATDYSTCGSCTCRRYQDPLTNVMFKIGLDNIAKTTSLSPNQITSISFVLGIVLVILLILFVQGKIPLVIVCVYMPLALSVRYILDILDGCVAYLQNKATNFGKIFDPVTDLIYVGAWVGVVIYALVVSRGKSKPLNITLVILGLLFLFAFVIFYRRFGNIIVAGSYLSGHRITEKMFDGRTEGYWCDSVIFSLIFVLMDLVIPIYALRVISCMKNK